MNKIHYLFGLVGLSVRHICRRTEDVSLKQALYDIKTKYLLLDSDFLKEDSLPDSVKLKYLTFVEKLKGDCDCLNPKEGIIKCSLNNMSDNTALKLYDLLIQIYFGLEDLLDKQ